MIDNTYEVGKKMHVGRVTLGDIVGFQNQEHESIYPAKQNEELIWVNEEDQVVGYGEKIFTHKKGILHRAFSIFIFDWNNATMLLQRRASSKYHSAGLWSNACCSHPTRNDLMEDALRLGLKKELGLNIQLTIVNPDDCVLLINDNHVIYKCQSFIYQSQVGNLIENEYDHVYLYSPDYNGFQLSDFHFNSDEIEDTKWVTIEELQNWLKKSPEDFTVWFQPAFQSAYEVLKRQAISRGLFF